MTRSARWTCVKRMAAPGMLAAAAACATPAEPPAWVVEKEASVQEELAGYPRLQDIPDTPSDARAPADWDAAIRDMKTRGQVLAATKPQVEGSLADETQAYSDLIRDRALAAAAAAPPVTPPPDVAPPPED